MLTPKDDQTTTTQSDKLPTYLQSLHHIRPARPSMVSQELGSDVPDISPKHLEASRSIFSSRYMQNRHRRSLRRAKLLLLQKTKPSTVSLNTNRFGGAERDRTADPLLAKQVLSQLSYSPISSIAWIAPGSATFRISHIPSSLTLICWCKWWAREDLNFRPHAYQACALTN